MFFFFFFFGKEKKRQGEREREREKKRKRIKKHLFSFPNSSAFFLTWPVVDGLDVGDVGLVDDDLSLFLIFVFFEKRRRGSRGQPDAAAADAAADC